MQTEQQVQIRKQKSTLLGVLFYGLLNDYLVYVMKVLEDNRIQTPLILSLFIS